MDPMRAFDDRGGAAGTGGGAAVAGDSPARRAAPRAERDDAIVATDADAEIERVTQPPIADYALIGDCHGSALVSRAGSIDWCCLLRFDGDPVFFRLLDASCGGCWDIRPDRLVRIERRYRDATAVLRTEFVTETGVLAVDDFMPVGRSRDASVHDYVSLTSPSWLVRRFECLDGTVSFATRFAPRGAGFSTEPLKLHREAGRLWCANGLSLWVRGDAEVTDEGGIVRYRLSRGEHEAAVLTMFDPLVDPGAHAEPLLATTMAFWREWVEYARYRGPRHDAVVRSAVTLKLLTFEPTGAIVAAPTTSLPEGIGGTRNWDYRYCWLRDASFAMYALSAIGYAGETRRFSDFLEQRCFRDGNRTRIMYSVDGDPLMPERELAQLAGYRDSRPVRIGNAAAEQNQLDVFGEVLDWAELRVGLGASLSKDGKAFLRGIADYVCAHWREPDQGLWEVRSGPLNFVHGKAMCWVALDRAGRLLGDRPSWQHERERIIAEILEHGCRGDPPYLAQAFENDEPDAALLALPLLGLPIDDAILAETVRQVEAGLRRGPFVHRYRGDDGLPGEEGAFFITSFWLVEALLMCDRAVEARSLFHELLGCANDVGLYAEEVDPRTRAFLGNFPQAFTHLALISSATMLDLHARGGRDALRGTHTDRARRLVGATAGLKSLVFALLRNRRIRLFSSKRSVLSIS
ncbi:MAG: glycoside hydrolase family 15 protein [Lautropia sp.]